MNTRIHAKRSIVCALAAVGLLAGCVQQLFYYPDRVLYETPDRAGLTFEEVSFPSRDGTRLAGWFIPARNTASPREAKGTVIHFHGNAQNISTHWRFIEWLPHAGYNAFVFDYRGYGASEGTPSPPGVFEDSRAAIGYVRSRPDVDATKLVIFGQSLGGVNAIVAVDKERPGVRALVVESAFASYSSIAGEKLKAAGMLVSDDYSADRFVAAIAPIPIIFVHGTDDTIVPFHHSERLFSLAREPKQLWTVPGGGHIEAFSERFGNRYRLRLLKFLSEQIGP